MAATRLHLLLVLFLFSPAVALAEVQQPVCPPGNLVLGATPSEVLDVLRPEAATDGRRAHQGAFWNTAFTSVLTAETSFIVYDLGKLVILNGLVIQVDNNDTYEISTSTTGSYFHRLETVPLAPEAGMQTHSLRNLDVSTRYLRIGLPRGDGAFSVGEVQVFCQMPASWPPDIPRAGSRPNAGTAGATLEARWDGNPVLRMHFHKLIIGVLGIFAFIGFMWEPLLSSRFGPWVGPLASASVGGYAASAAWGVGALVVLVPLFLMGSVWISRRVSRGAPTHKRSQSVAMIVLLGAAALSWTNFGLFNGTDHPTVHLHDFMHYYIGSKYFEENDYRWMYHCVALAELEDGHDLSGSHRNFRSLKDNRSGPAAWIIEEAEVVCREHFTPQRWRAFRQDVRMFRGLMGARTFEIAFLDHGYNATPAWTMVGSVLTNWNWERDIPDRDRVNSPANLQGKSRSQIDVIQRSFNEDRAAFYSKVKLLAWIDSGLYIGVFAMIMWAFGLPASALAALAWSIGHPWSFLWTGGSLGRVSWLFTAVAGLCFLKKGYHALGGAGIAWSLLLRVFPGGLGGGIALAFLWNAIVRRRVDHTHLQVLAGAIAALVSIVLLSLALAGGPASYSRFLDNSLKHVGTPLSNHMGLRTLVTANPRYLTRHMIDDRLDDPASTWKAKRLELYDEYEVLYWGLLLGLVVLVGSAARNMENWEAMAISTLLIFGVFELTNYYFVFLVILAPSCIKRPSYAAALLATSAGTQWVGLQTGWADENGIASTALVLALMLYVIGSEAWSAHRSIETAER